jgi:DNA-binding NtrC family response regulator
VHEAILSNPGIHFSSSSHAAMKATILLVDDYPGMRRSLGGTLRLEGYDVVLASNGQEALNALRATGFDLVLLGLDMPVCDGWDTLCQIITISLTLPLIIISKRPDQHWLATQQGVTAVLERPLDMHMLLDVLERVHAQTTHARQQRIESGHASSAS